MYKYSPWKPGVPENELEPIKIKNNHYFCDALQVNIVLLLNHLIIVNVGEESFTFNITLVKINLEIMDRPIGVIEVT